MDSPPIYRKLHAPPLVGFLLRNRKFLPVDPSYSTASAAGAIAGAADFSFKFLPANPSCYAVSDIRDGRVLLNLQPFDNRCLVVCDPLHRRFALLPPIPSSYDWVEPPRLKAMGGPPPTIQVQAFLAPAAAADEEAGEDTSFRVFWMASKQKKQNQLQLAFVFSSVTGQWETIPLKISLALHSQRQYACRCFYWVTDCGKNLLVLDAHTAEFSLADLPPQVRDFDDVDVDIAIVEAGEGCLGAFFLEYVTSDLSYIVRRNSDESSNQWELEKTISLSSSSYSFGNCTATHLFLHDCGSGSNDGALFSLDVKTFKLEKVFASQYGMRALDFHAYSNFPPILSTPTISSEMYSVENTGASGNTSGSGQLVWTNSMSTMMLNYLVVLVAVGASTSDQFTRVHHNYCAKALSGHFKVAITSKQVCNHIKKWREIWGKVEKVKYYSGALWDASTCNIRHSEKHSAGHSKARKDIPFLKTSVEQCRAMERIFGTTTAKSGSETLSVKVREIEEDVVGDGNGEVNLLRNVGEPSNSKPPPKKKAKVVNTENDA